MNYLRSRLIKLQAWLKDQEIEAYLITTPANLTYLTGAYPVNQHEREAYLLVTPKAAHLLISPLRAVDPRLVKHLTVHTISPQYNLNQFIQEAHLRYRDIVVEVNNLIYSEAKLLEEQKGLNLLPVKNFLLNLRLVKDKQEIANITKACHITAQTWKKIHPLIKPGVTELELAQKIIQVQTSLGAQGIPAGFDPIVASGIHSAVPHHTSSTKKIKAGDVVLFDFGCTVGGYASDFTRTIKLGKPSPEFHRIETAVLVAYDQAIKALPERNATKLDQATLNHFKSQRLDRYILHTTGHGLGLDIHEPPSLSIHNTSHNQLKPDMAITIEPGLYLPQKFGYRHENTLLITPSGHQTLT